MYAKTNILILFNLHCLTLNASKQKLQLKVFQKIILTLL